MRRVSLGFLALTGALWVTDAGASGSLVVRDAGVTRLDRTWSVRIGTDAARGERLAMSMRARADELGLADALAAGLKLRSRERAALSGSDLAIVVVEGSFGSVPLARPIARAVVDLADGGRVRMLTTDGSVAPPADFGVSVDAWHALAMLDRSGLVGSRGAVEAELVAVPGDGQTRLMWRIDPPLDFSVPTNPVFLVDANTGSILTEYDRVRFADVEAFSANPVSTPNSGVYTLHDIDDQPTHLIGQWFEARDCNEPGGWGGSCQSNPAIAPDAQGDFFVTMPDVTMPGDNTAHDDLYAQVSMYYHADKFLQSLFDIGFAGLPCHVEGERATLIANYKRFDDQGEPVAYDNAFYGGSCNRTMSFGQGTQVDFSYDGDVVYHELGHGVVEQQMTGDFLGRARRREEALLLDAGGINEAIADFLSSSYTGDPLVAEYVGKYWTDKELDGGVIRDNDNEFVCPHDLVGEVHLDGEPYAALLWRSYVALGADTIPIVLDTITALPGDATLEEASAAYEELVETALGANAAATVSEEIEARGMDVCERITTHDRLRKPMFVQGARRYQPHPPPPLQLRFDVPPGARSMELSYEIKARSGSFAEERPEADLQAVVLVKHDTRVTYEYEDLDDVTNVTHDADDRYEDANGGELSIPASGGDVLFVSFVNEGEDEMLVDNVTVEYPGAGGGSTGTDDGGDDSTGGSPSSDSGTPADGTSGGEDPSTDGTDSGEEDAGEASGSGCGCTQHPSGRWAPIGLVVLIACVRRRTAA